MGTSSDVEAAVKEDVATDEMVEKNTAFRAALEIPGSDSDSDSDFQ